MATATETITAHPTSYDTTHYSYASLSSSYPMSNAYTDSSSTTYAQVNWKTGSSAETYVYLKFDFSEIPSTATITSVSASAKGYVNTTSSSRVTTRQMQLATGTTLKGSALTISTSTSAQTFTNTGTWTVAELQDAGVRFYVKRGTSNTSSTYQLRMYGATMTVTYTVATHEITITNSTSAIVTTAESEVGEGEDVEIFANTLDGITIKDNNVDVTSQFVRVSGETINATAESFTTELSASGASFYTGSSSTGNYFDYAVGHTAASPGSTSTSYNTYVKDNSNNTATGWAWYEFDFSEIPTTATITDVTVQCYGACESTTHDSTHKANITLYSGSTLKSTEQYFTSTSNSTITINNPGTWTADELYDARLKFEVAYYGGRLFGITWSVTYEVEGYIYTITNIVADHTIIVTTSGGTTPTIYFKNNGTWVAATKVYKKINGSWVQQSDLTSVFSSGVNYLKG